jgi:hypothetical protein
MSAITNLPLSHTTRLRPPRRYIVYNGLSGGTLGMPHAVDLTHRNSTDICSAF